MRLFFAMDPHSVRFPPGGSLRSLRLAVRGGRRRVEKLVLVDSAGRLSLSARMGSVQLGFELCY
jgi:hypothetical protein